MCCITNKFVIYLIQGKALTKSNQPKGEIDMKKWQRDGYAVEETAFDDDPREETNAADEEEQIEDIETPDELDLRLRTLRAVIGGRR